MFPIWSWGYVPDGYYAPSVGRLYGLSQDGSHWTLCTAAVVTRDVVLTAGHCVFDLESGQQNYGWVFVPGMEGSSQPAGAWVGRSAGYWTDYATTREGSLDYAFVRLDPDQNGRLIANVTGENGILEYASPSAILSEGYPSAGAFSQYCSPDSCYATYCASPRGARGADDYGNQIGMGCITNEGASGGPWFMPFQGRWLIGSVSSTASESNGSYYRNQWGPQFTPNLDRLLQYAETS